MRKLISLCLLGVLVLGCAGCVKSVDESSNQDEVMENDSGTYTREVEPLDPPNMVEGARVPFSVSKQTLERDYIFRARVDSIKEVERAWSWIDVTGEEIQERYFFSIYEITPIEIFRNGKNEITAGSKVRILSTVSSRRYYDDVPKIQPGYEYVLMTQWIDREVEAFKEQENPSYGVKIYELAEMRTVSDFYDVMPIIGDQAIVHHEYALLESLSKKPMSALVFDDMGNMFTTQEQIDEYLKAAPYDWLEKQEFAPVEKQARAASPTSGSDTIGGSRAAAPSTHSDRRAPIIDLALVKIAQEAKIEARSLAEDSVVVPYAQLRVELLKGRDE